jgi:glutamate dehydrogenase
MDIFSSKVEKLSISQVQFSLDDKEDKLFLYVEGNGKKLTLSKAIPILENVGLSISQCGLNETNGDFWQLVFQVDNYPKSICQDDKLTADLELFLIRLFSGVEENDILNRLALSPIRSVDYLPVLRAITKYLYQIKVNFGVDSLYKCLITNEDVTVLLIEYFHAKFDPFTQGENNQISHIGARLEENIDAIFSRDEDLICRHYYSVIKAIIRTNFYIHNESSDGYPALSFKIKPDSIDGIPKPVPVYEIFIYNQFVEGVHLRGGKVARGGIRFSDRPDDYRTEVLGLVKAQMVKNSVIVPVGAKGGFVCKIDLVGMKKTDYMDFVKACYETFIRAILDITDNRWDGKIIPPKNVVRHDDDDPYLVVAADKGTATFSDFANSIAEEYKYWLGDAFASGGTNGYDHKKMGITAKGAWQSAKRLFIELGKNLDEDPITVVGIGDMSGDVFGNGLLLSDQIRLIAAFNHRHIFIDPEPDPDRSFAERQRLFKEPYSSWSDYDINALSTGGGVFERSLKSIQLSAEAAKALKIDSSQTITPDELIKTILCADIDMLWNGGIGTYVKSSDETDLDVSDKANDRVRVDAKKLKAKVVAEGGNLGLTQKARIEYALHGGLIHMDAVDNSAGVDCSDHEVNIKILLDEMIKENVITADERNELLAEISPSVSSMVLNNNFRQSKMLSQSNYTAPYFFDSFIQLINLLERDGVLDREMACIPLPEELDNRIASQEYFTRPELATLLSYSKTRLFMHLATSELINEEFFQGLLLQYFPDKLAQRYPAYIKRHPLRKEILASYLTNDVANRIGATFCNYVLEEGKVDVSRLIKAHMTAVEIFNLNGLYQSIDKLLYTVNSQDLLDLQLAIHYPLDKAMSWLIQEGLEDEVHQIAVNTSRY